MQVFFDASDIYSVHKRWLNEFNAFKLYVVDVCNWIMIFENGEFSLFQETFEVLNHHLSNSSQLYQPSQTTDNGKGLKQKAKNRSDART